MTATSKQANQPLDLAAFEGHNAGSWHAKPIEGGDYRISTAHDALGIATVHQGPRDARLIAAAPALLAECKRQREEIAALRAALEAMRANYAQTDWPGDQIAREQCDSALAGKGRA